LKRQTNDYKIILTDKFPNISSFEYTAHESEGKIDFIKSSIDAMNVPRNLKGFRTQFVSFHHFKPEAAQQILANAAESDTPIAIFEVTERNWTNLMGMLFTPIVV